MAEPKYNLSTDEAIVELEVQHKKMKAEPRGELPNVDPDTAFELGYEVAIFDLKHLTGPDPADHNK